MDDPYRSTPLSSRHVQLRSRRDKAGHEPAVGTDRPWPSWLIQVPQRPSAIPPAAAATAARLSGRA